jgi:hypothetical protein
LMELLVSYLYQIQLRTHAVLLLELFLLNDPHERFTAVQVTRMFLDLLVLSVDILMAGDPTK